MPALFRGSVTPAQSSALDVETGLASAIFRLVMLANP
jgi:hypothetical protein